MNIMTVDGYHAKTEFDEELDLFRGEIFGLNGGADFYGQNPAELRSEFKKSLQVLLEVCQEKGIGPEKHFSGKFNLRISPTLHEQIAIRAQAEGKSINTEAQEALQFRVTRFDRLGEVWVCEVVNGLHCTCVGGSYPR